jgi:predicted transcriptional regulator of viral defense system
LSSRAAKIKKHLVVDEEKLLDDSLERLKKVVVLTKEGNVHFVVDRRSLSDRQLIALYLIGKRYAHEAHIIQEQFIDLNQISKDLLLDLKVSAARLAELTHQGLVERHQRGKYSASPFAAESVLDEIETLQPATPTSEESISPISTAEIPVIKPTKRTTTNIERLFETAWGRSPRSASEVAKALEMNAASDTPTNVRVYLGRLVSSGKLRRIEREGKYAYFRLPS